MLYIIKCNYKKVYKVVLFEINTVRVYKLLWTKEEKKGSYWENLYYLTVTAYCVMF